MQSEINIKVANKAPNLYMQDVKKQCAAGKFRYGGIDSVKDLEMNLEMHCIPDTIYSMDIDSYDEFLEQRRILMAQKMKDYYFSL